MYKHGNATRIQRTQIRADESDPIHVEIEHFQIESDQTGSSKSGGAFELGKGKPPCEFLPTNMLTEK